MLIFILWVIVYDSYRSKIGEKFQNMCSFIKNNISNVKSRFLNRAYRGQNATCSGIYHYPGIWHSDQGPSFYTITSGTHLPIRELKITDRKYPPEVSFWSRKVLEGVQIMWRSCFEKAISVHFVSLSKIMITCQKVILVHFKIVRKGAFGPNEQWKMDQNRKFEAIAGYNLNSFKHFSGPKIKTLGLKY